MGDSHVPRRESWWLRPQALGSAVVLLLGGLIASRVLNEYRRSPQHDLAVCKSHLAQIHAALEAYRRDHGGEYPYILTKETEPFYEGLYPRYIRDRRVFFCPSVQDRRYHPPGMIGYNYAYNLEVDPFFLNGHIPVGPALVKFHRQVLQRFGPNTTLIWCPAHVPPAAPRPGMMLSLKASGAQVWEPMGGRTDQEKLSIAFRDNTLRPLMRLGNRR